MNLPSTCTGLRDRLAVRHLRRADVGFDAEFALHAVDEDLEVQLAHARDDRLARFLVGVDAERRVFLREAIERDAHLLLVGLGLRLDGDVDHRLREDHLLEHDHVLRVAQRVAGRRFLQADRRRDVAGAHFLDLLALVGVHLQDAADAFLAALDRVVDRVARIDDARIDAEEDQLADVGVGHDLEREARERLVVGGACARPPCRSRARPSPAECPSAPACSRSRRRASPARPCS